MLSSKMTTYQLQMQYKIKERAKLTTEIMDLYGLIQKEQESQEVAKTIEYQAYIDSDEWAQKAASVRLRAGNKCQLCGCKDRELNVHHNTYDRLGRELPEDLICLCEPCHAKFHGVEEKVETPKFGRAICQPVPSAVPEERRRLMELWNAKQAEKEADREAVPF